MRDSFVQYLGSGTASSDGAKPVSPATADPASTGCNSDGTANDALLLYQFHFPFKEGWYDPATGRAAVYFTGAVHFGYKAHGIDLTANEPEIELDGASSRAIFRFTGSGSSDPGNKRDVLVNMDTGRPPAAKACSADPGPQGTTGVSGSTRTYERIVGTIPQGSDTSVFAGFYQPGEQFGWMTVSFTTA